MEQPHQHHHHHHLNHHCHHHPHHHGHHHHHHHHHHRMVIHPCSISSSHHHHHHVIVHHCALHNPITNPQPTLPLSLPTTPFPASSASIQTQILQDDGANKFDEEEDEELIFVMTDEWRDFFAKSDARRREAKKLAKRQGKS